MTAGSSDLLKKIGIYRKPVCHCYWHPQDDKICLAVCLGSQRIDMLLTKQQWKNLKRFLKMTITQKSFPKNHQGFYGFDITTNKSLYYSNDREIRISELIKKGPALVKERRRLKRELEDILENRLTSTIEISCNSTVINLTRTAFYLFREAILREPRGGLRKEEGA